MAKQANRMMIGGFVVIARGSHHPVHYRQAGPGPSELDLKFYKKMKSS